MFQTKRKPVSAGEILAEEFLLPLNLTQTALAIAMGVQRKHVGDLCNGRRAITPTTAAKLANALGTSTDFWLTVQRRQDLWNAGD